MNTDAQEVAEIIRNFLYGSGGEREWDDFISIRLKDPWLESIRRRANATRDEYPPSDPHAWCADEGVRVLKELVQEIEDQLKKEND